MWQDLYVSFSISEFFFRNIIVDMSYALTKTPHSVINRWHIVLSILGGGDIHCIWKLFLALLVTAMPSADMHWKQSVTAVFFLFQVCRNLMPINKITREKCH